MTFRKLANGSVVSLLYFHHSLLADEARTQAYRAAIDATVREGDVVADIGCGSGILSFFACRAGARRVYAIDEGPVIELARELARENGFADRITFLAASSYDTTLPEPVDVIITETMGNNGLDEGIVGALIDARRWLRPDGAIVPLALSVIAAPAEFPRELALYDFWSTRPFGLEMQSVMRSAANAFHAVEIDPASLLSAAGVVARVDFHAVDRRAVRGAGTFSAARRGRLSGLAVWFDADLAPDVSIENAPNGAYPSWKQSFFPIETPIDVEAGDTINVRIDTYDGIEWRWSVAVNDNARIEQATLRSFPPLR